MLAPNCCKYLNVWNSPDMEFSGQDEWVVLFHFCSVQCLSPCLQTEDGTSWIWKPAIIKLQQLPENQEGGHYIIFWYFIIIRFWGFLKIFLYIILMLPAFKIKGSSHKTKLVSFNVCRFVASQIISYWAKQPLKQGCLIYELCCL